MPGPPYPQHTHKMDWTDYNIVPTPKIKDAAWEFAQATINALSKKKKANCRIQAKFKFQNAELMLEFQNLFRGMLHALQMKSKKVDWIWCSNHRCMGDAAIIILIAGTAEAQAYYEEIEGLPVREGGAVESSEDEEENPMGL